MSRPRCRRLPSGLRAGASQPVSEATPGCGAWWSGHPWNPYPQVAMVGLALTPMEPGMWDSQGELWEPGLWLV